MIFSRFESKVLTILSEPSRPHASASARHRPRGPLRRILLPGLAMGLAVVGLISPSFAPAQEAATPAPAQVLTQVLTQLVAMVDAPAGQAPRTFSATLKLSQGAGLPKGIEGRSLDLAFQAPDRLWLATAWEGRRIEVGRDGEDLWIYTPEKKFGVVGSPGKPLFASAPEMKDNQPLGPIKLPIKTEQLAVLPFLMDVKGLPPERIGATACSVLQATAKPEAIDALKLPRGTLQLWVRTNDWLPLRLAYREGRGTEMQLEVVEPQLQAGWPAERWKLRASDGVRVETVARSHLTRFLDVAMRMLGEKVPPLGPATGERRVVAREGDGRLELRDGTRVLFLKGTPEEMGRQHGALLKKDVRELVDHMLFGVGVGSSFEKGAWVLGQIEEAQRRVTPFTDERYFREMDALASAAGLPREEVRLANFFPEMFHCSGFAVFGKATVDGRLYHGRILDYLRGLGLEQSAVVSVFQPDHGNAWVNVGYAGFIGSVTAMNEKGVAIGEMGGRGEGEWDGKPMAQLVREVMERANTLDEAVEIMRKGPRTCEYYYVISDGKSRRAVGIAATPTRFETIAPGESHPQLPHPISDAVLMSAGDRYEELARRVKAGYGKLDAAGARDLMKRPVSMNSNIHCALFAPETLDFWVANADSENVAAHTRYTQYNLKELLAPEKGE